MEEHAVADVARDGEAVYVYGALKVGAYGFLLKDTPPGRLLAAIHTVHAGDILFSASVIKGLIETCNLRPAAPEAPLRAANRAVPVLPCSPARSTTTARPISRSGMACAH